MGDWQHQLIWNAIAYAAVGGAALLALGALFFATPALRRSWLPIARFRPMTWTGNDVFLAFCIYVGFQQVIVETLLQIGFFTPLLGPPPARDEFGLPQIVYGLRCTYIASPLSLTLSFGFLLTMLYARSGVRPHHFGLTWSRWLPNLALGLAAFLVMRPIVIGVFAAAILVFPPRIDPFPELGRQDPPSWEWMLFAFHSMVAAPLLEEVVCRGLLQNWLRRASLLGHVTFLFMTLFTATLLSSGNLVRHDQETDTYSYTFGPVVFTALLASGYGFWLFHLKRKYDLTEEETQTWQPLPRGLSLQRSATAFDEEAQSVRRESRRAEEQRLQAWTTDNARLAILGSSMLFAAIHSNWPAPLALFPMGLVLGWLYHRTQSLIGPVTFHALFNLTTFVALYGSIMSR